MSVSIEGHAIKEQVFCDVCRKTFARTADRIPWPPKCRRCAKLYGQSSGTEPDHETESAETGS